MSGNPTFDIAKKKTEDRQSNNVSVGACFLKSIFTSSVIDHHAAHSNIFVKSNSISHVKI